MATDGEERDDRTPNTPQCDRTFAKTVRKREGVPEPPDQSSIQGL